MKPLERLKKSDFRLLFRWIDKKTYGLIDFENETITVNLELFVVAVVIHELLHLEHPSWSEKMVLKTEERRVRRMSVKEIHQLARRLLKEGHLV